MVSSTPLVLLSPTPQSLDLDSIAVMWTVCLVALRLPLRIQRPISQPHCDLCRSFCLRSKLVNNPSLGLTSLFTWSLLCDCERHMQWSIQLLKFVWVFLFVCLFPFFFFKWKGRVLNFCCYVWASWNIQIYLLIYI